MLIVPESPFYRAAETDVTAEAAEAATGERPRDSLPAWLQRLIRPFIEFDPPLTMWTDRSLFRHLNECTAQMQILNLGAGAGLFDKYLGPHLNLINLDVSLAATNLDAAADAHFLPFADESLDAVYSNAVLEHVQRPWRVAEEIHRVLRPGGKVFINVPFLNVIHDTHDYFRFTDKGLEILFADFEKIDGGVSAGPSSFLGPFLISYLLCFVPGRHLKVLLRRPLSLLAWPLKYLDAPIRRSADLRLTADAFYFVGVKKS
jgi:SAM-dependent methyltransferase